MKVLVIGAGGKTGKLVVEKALAAGHLVTALLHSDPTDDQHKDDKKKEAALPPQVQLFHGDVRNPTKLGQALEGQEAVIDCIGGTKPFLTTDRETAAAKVVIDGMKRNGVKRLIVTSALGEGSSIAQTGFFYEHLLMPVFLRGIVEDKKNMEAEVEHSGLDFTIVRPSILTDGEEMGKTHVVVGGETAHKVPRAGVAEFLVEQLTSGAYLGQAVTITAE